MVWDGKFDLNLMVSKDVVLFSELFILNLIVKKVMSVKDINEKGNWKFSFKLLVVGFYFLNFFGWNEKEKNKKVEEIYSFLIQFIGLLSKEELEKLVKKGKVRKGVKDIKFGFERLNIVFDSEF